MNKAKFVLSLLFNPSLTEFAKLVDYVHILDDGGDLVVILGRYKKNPHAPVLECIKTIQRWLGGTLRVDEHGRTILTIIIRRPER